MHTNTNNLLRHANLSDSNLVSQIFPQVPELRQRFLDHVSVCLIRNLFKQELPLVAQLLHVYLLLVDFNLELLQEEKMSPDFV